MIAPRHAPTDFPWKNLPEGNSPRLPIEHLIQCAYDRARKHPQQPEMDLVVIHLEESLLQLKQLHERLAKAGVVSSAQPWCMPATMAEALAQGTGG